MKNTDTPFTDVYIRWLDSLRALMPGGAGKPTNNVPAPKPEELAKQEWEHEGGSLKPGAKKPAAKKQGAKKARKRPRG